MNYDILLIAKGGVKFVFQNCFVRIKVKLNSDLTNYETGLICGLEGFTLGNAYKDDIDTAVIDVYFEKN